MKYVFLCVLCVFASYCFAQTTSGSISKAKSYATKNDYDAAAKEYQQKLKTDSNNYEANFEYGMLQTNYLNNPGEGGKFLLRAERLSKKDTASQIIYGLAQYYQYEEQYPKAIAYYNRTLMFIEDDEDGTTLKTRISQSILDCEYAIKNPKAANRKQIRIVNVGGGINTLYPEYVPLVNKEETIMMFTSRRKDTPKAKINEDDGEYFEDMYIANKDKGSDFKNAHPFSIKDAGVKDLHNTTKDHESVISISYDGNKFFTYRKNKIYESDLKNNVWTAPKELDTSVNADMFQNHLCISKDGKTIYFSSERNDGVGGLDLYKADRLANGTWSKAISLGDAINTKEDEESPFISEDGKTLYFSSKGHTGYGRYDIYKSTYDGTTWGTPENMGLPFNSAGDDIYMTINANETHGYLASSRAGGYGDMDIYAIIYLRVPFETYAADIPGVITFTAPDTMYLYQTLSVSVQSFTPAMGGQPTEFKTVNWGVNDSVLQSHTSNANYTFSKEGTYKVRIEAQTTDDNFLSFDKNIVVIPKVTQQIAGNQTTSGNTDAFGLEPVYFAFNKSGLNKAAKQAVDRNIKTLNEHPNATIEIAAYCDARGSADYNQLLSERRAKAVINYLKQKNFDVKRVKQVDWFGEKDPVNKCTDQVPCTEEEYKLNRRAAFRLVK